MPGDEPVIVAVRDLVLDEVAFGSFADAAEFASGGFVELDVAALADDEEADEVGFVFRLKCKHKCRRCLSDERLLK